jgi:hypothetical protein
LWDLLSTPSDDGAELSIRRAGNVCDLVYRDSHGRANPPAKLFEEQRTHMGAPLRSWDHAHEEFIECRLLDLRQHDSTHALENRIEPANPATIRGEHEIISAALDGFNNGKGASAGASRLGIQSDQISQLIANKNHCIIDEPGCDGPTRASFDALSVGIKDLEESILGVKMV